MKIYIPKHARPPYSEVVIEGLPKRYAVQRIQFALSVDECASLDVDVINLETMMKEKLRFNSVEIDGGIFADDCDDVTNEDKVDMLQRNLNNDN